MVFYGCIISKVEYTFIYLLVIGTSCTVIFLVSFSFRPFYLFLLLCRSSLEVMGFNPLSVICIANIFSEASAGCFIFFRSYFHSSVFFEYLL